MLISELIEGFEKILKEHGNLPIYFVTNDLENKQIAAGGVLSGGAANLGKDGALCAYVSCQPTDVLFSQEVKDARPGLVDDDIVYAACNVEGAAVTDEVEIK